MKSEVIPYLIPYFISAFISLGVAFYAWQRRQVKGTRPFLWLVLSQALWTFCYAFELANPTLKGKVFWDDVQFVASLMWPLMYLLFIYEFSGLHWRRPHLVWSVLATPLFCFLLLLLTDNRHHLVRQEAFLIPGGLIDVLYYEFTVAVMLIAVYVYGLIFAGIYILIKSFAHAQRLYRKQIALVLIGTMFPIMGTLLTLFGVTIAAQRDTTPLTFAISNVIIAWALYRYGLFDIVPIAREKVVENMSDLVFVLDSRNRVVDINPAAQAVLGVKNGDVIGQSAGDILPDWQYLLPLLETEQENLSEVEVIYKGEPYFLALKITPLYGDNETLNGRLIVARDITSMKQAEQKLQEHAAQLEDANVELLALGEVKDEFVANVSHELRTPLANLKLYHDLLLRNPTRMAAYTEILQRETQRLELIIEDLLTLSRLDRKDEAIQTEATDINMLVQTLVQDRQRLAEQEGVNLQFQVQTSLPLAMIDASMITQALSILLTNAVNYTPAGGEILVYTQMKQAPTQTWVGFCVQDTGYGIAADEQTRLFTRFFRGEASRQAGRAGTGLGLAIAKEIVDQHNGEIELHSSGVPGEGTAVSIWLPLFISFNGTA
ncbi:MAG: PAS domain S-box protein [Anaerolineae bacterium]|nr:PAS domain S-box protein [Anaerolineae bacterium]